jgi:hypothetical protein
VTVLTGGSGYTNGATFTFANGSITNIGASGMIAATGGVITGITIPSGNQGYGYTTPPTTGTSGTGTGFTFTAIMGWKENLCIFNTTTGHFNIVVGGAWVEVSNTNSAETLTNKTLTSPQLTPLTVATLPTSPTAGMMACVTDAATLPTMGAAVGSGGGSYFAGVMYNGTQWSVFSL